MKDKRPYNQQPNIITRSTDEMSVIEKRIVYLVINRMDAGFNLNHDLFKNMEFTLNLSELKDTNYARVKKAVQKLRSRGITLIDDDETQEFEQITPFPHVKIKAGKVTIRMMADVVPYFLELKKGFTKYELAAALSLSSVYSQKLYELLSRWQDKGEWSVTVTELQLLLNAQKYKYGDFKIHCIDTAVKELNEKTNLAVSWEPEKSGRNVIAINFKVRTKIRQEQEEAKEAVNEEMKQMHTLTPGEIMHYTQRLLSDYTFSQKQKEQIMSNINLFNQFVELESKIANGVIKNVKNPTAYMAKSLFIQKK